MVPSFKSLIWQKKKSDVHVFTGDFAKKSSTKMGETTDRLTLKWCLVDLCHFLLQRRYNPPKIKKHPALGTSIKNTKGNLEKQPAPNCLLKLLQSFSQNLMFRSFFQFFWDPAHNLATFFREILDSFVFSHHFCKAAKHPTGCTGSPGGLHPWWWRLRALSSLIRNPEIFGVSIQTVMKLGFFWCRWMENI